MPYKSIFDSPTVTPPANKDYANDFIPGQYAKVNAGIAAHNTAPKSAGLPKVQAAIPPNGPTGFWNRITEVGVGKVNLANLDKTIIQHKPAVQSLSPKQDVQTVKQGVEAVGKGVASFAKSTAVSTKKGFEGAATGIARMLPGGQNDLKAQEQQVTNANNASQSIIKMRQAGKLNRQQAAKLLSQQAENSSQANAAASKTLKSEPTTKEFAGDIAQTALLGAGGGGKAVEVTGADLLKTFGTQGVKDLAEKAGIDLGGKASIEGAEAVAKTKLAQQAFQKATTSVAGRALKSSAKGAAGFGTFSAAQEAGQGGSNKQILKAGGVGAAEGGLAGAGGSLLKSGVKAKFGNTPTIEKATATKEDTTPSPVNALGKKAEARNALIGKKSVGGAQASEALTQPKTKLLGAGEGKVEGTGFTAQPSADATKMKLSARLNTINQKLNNVAQGKTTMAPEDIKSLNAEKTNIGKVASGSAKVEDFKDTPGEIKISGATAKTTAVKELTGTRSQAETTVKPGKTVIQGTTKLKTSPGPTISGSALKQEQKDVAAGLATESSEKAGYKSTSYESDSEDAVKLAYENPEKALDIATGKKAGKNPSHEVAVRRAVTTKARNEGDTDTLQKLLASRQHTATSEAAQRMGAEGYNADENDPVTAMQHVAAARTAAVEKQTGQSMNKAVTQATKEIDSHIKPVSKQTWAMFVESIKC